MARRPVRGVRAMVPGAVMVAVLAAAATLGGCGFGDDDDGDTTPAASSIAAAPEDTEPEGETPTTGASGDATAEATDTAADTATATEPDTATSAAGTTAEEVTLEVGAPAPAFAADELDALPTQNWITNGGSLANQRYSPLDEITTENVADVKGEWMIDLDGSGTAAKYSGEAQPIVYAGVAYVVTGADDVFAVDVESGDVKWKYEAKLDQKISTVCCGWTSRGVAIGDGLVFVGQLDGQLVALDMATGEQVWATAVGDWKKGETITNAPLYYDGLVYTGLSGGEFGIRGRLMAYDAKTGEEAWRFYTIPGPGEVGHDSWPAENDAWKTGGAPVWQTPSVDPELGLLYFSTGNASPDLDGSKRAGDNLFAASMVAIDAKTGEYRWHFQQVHHDIWDYDAPSPTVLFDVEIDGEMRKGIGEASKTGWVYLLDRETGEPLHPIPETPVPQLPIQKTAKTQPIPSYESIIPHEVTDDAFNQIKKLAEANAKDAGGPAPKVTRAKDIYTPFHKQPVVMTPGPAGGTNWPPSSYNPDTGLFYVCAQRSVSGYQFTEQTEFKQGQVYIGSVFTLLGFGLEGTFAAFDPVSGTVKWSKQWPDSCYSGSTTTAGNLVFVGRNSGDLEAYDATTGDRVWQFQTGAGANTTATVFEHEGKQKILFYAAGNSLAGSAHGDNLWLLSLDGDMGPAEPGGKGDASEHAGEETPPGEENEENVEGDAAGNVKVGATIYSDNCSGCHGFDGQGANGGPDLSGLSADDRNRVIEQVTNGGGGMPAFGDSLSEQQIIDVSEYVIQTVAGNKP